MANQVKRIVLSDRDRAELRRRVASKSLPAREVARARIVLLAEEGLAARDVSELVGCSEPTVLKWRAACERHGLRGLEDGPRSGRPPVHQPEKRFEVWWKTRRRARGAP